MIKKLLVRFGLTAGLLLSVASALNLCATDACSQAHKYTLLRVSMPVLGMIFFISAGIMYELGSRIRHLSVLFLLAVFGAGGAEVAFILIQKFRIQQWCPLCLGIAAAVYLIIAVILYERLVELISMIEDRRMMLMSLVKKIVTVAVVFVAGFLVAYKGMDAGGAEERVVNIFLGKQDSPVEVFVMTDWFCPFCVKAEQEIEKVIPVVRKKAKIFFVDVPIHQETLNYMPHNLSLLTYEKDRYIELRKALLILTKKTKEPTVEDVREALKPMKAVYKPLSFLDATKGMKFFESVAREFKIDRTPIVVVRDTKTNRITR
ncbi:MAG TPA: thioredoxin domain-containing protein, partial [Thermodesulfovibrionales bacterium]|nr:thioredoxin domain-containing protein [Thermodesulfovibrionales bacterium]